MRPLLGQTVLAVEDSRYACEAIRLVCLRSGARIRRADCLAAARRHLRAYRPTVVLVDRGLPDGSGMELIEELAALDDPPVILGISADDTEEAAARRAGAHGFLAKPMSSLAQFQAAVLAHLPAERQPLGPRPVIDDDVAPDTIAFHDDIAHAQQALEDGERAYAAQFLAGVARCTGAEALLGHARALAEAPENAELSQELAAYLDALQETREPV
ncbi:MAG: response regulator [Pseudomonadota bacterium]